MRTCYATLALVAALLPVLQVRAQNLNGAVVGYAEGGGASAAVVPGSVYNASGGAVTVTRTSAGFYLFTFDGAASAARLENVHVSVVEGDGVCSMTNVQPAGDDLYVYVGCALPDGTAADHVASVLVIRTVSALGNLAYALANQPTEPAYTPPAEFSVNSQGSILVSRSSQGRYEVAFAGIMDGGGHVQVIAAEGGSPRPSCETDGWGPDATALVVSVSCTRNGALADVRFEVLFVPSGTATPGLAFLWANEPTAASYAPEPLYAQAPGALQIVRSGTGHYTVYVAGFAAGAVGVNAQVTPYDAPTVFCRSVVAGGSPFHVDVECRSTAGGLADTRFDLLLFSTARLAATEGEPEAGGVTLRPASPNPVSGATTLAFHLPAPSDARLAVYDLLGREVAVLADGPQAAGTREVVWDAAGLPAGVYVARLTTEGVVRSQRVVVAR